MERINFPKIEKKWQSFFNKNKSYNEGNKFYCLNVSLSIW